MKPRLIVSIVGFLVAVNALAQGTTGPVIKRIYFEPVAINNIEVKSPTYPIDEPKLRSDLETQFSTWIVRSVKGQQLAPEAFSIGTHAAGAGEYVLTTTLGIPLTHRADTSHRSNQIRRGRFMEYHFTLTGPDGTVVASVTGGLTWGDGHWTNSRPTGASSKVRRRRFPDQAHNEVMKAYVRKAVDRGVAALKKALNTGATGAVATSFKHVQWNQPDSHPAVALNGKRGRP
jgi:hypothetical protein